MVEHVQPESLTGKITEIAPHTAIYEVTVGGFEVGHIRYQLRQLPGKHYEYRIDSDLGIVLLSDKRQILSQFTMDKKAGSIGSLRFTQIRKGTGGDQKEKIVFSLPDKKATGTYKNKTRTLKLSRSVYDALNAQLQMRLDLLKGKQIFKYPYISGNKMEKVEFRGIEKLPLTFDKYRMMTERMEMVRKNKKRQTRVWFAKDLAYLPLRIEDSRNGKEAIVATLIYYEQSLPSGLLSIGKKVPVKTIYEVKEKKKSHLRK